MKGRPLRTRATDQSLRRLVAKLARSSPDDVLGVLDRLAPAHRREVATLLKAYDGAFVDRDAAEDGPGARTGAWRVSPWLAERLVAAEARNNGRATGSSSFVLTPAASATLLSCATDAGVREAPGEAPPAPARRQSSRLQMLLAPRRGRP